MGKASSAKKVARVARTSGGPSRERPKLGFPAAIVGIVLVGSLMVVWARTTTESASASPPTLNDHWHAAYGIFVCDEFLPGLVDVAPDTTGIHTHDDGIVHVHPFGSGSSGENANWAKFGDVVDLSFDGTSFTTGGTTYSDGFDCDGQPATVSMYQWPADDPDAEPIIHTEDLGSVHFGEDRLAFTIAVVPEGTEVPRPPSIPTLDNLSDVAPDGSDLETTTTVPAAGTSSDGEGATTPVEGTGGGADGATPETTVPSEQATVPGDAEPATTTTVAP